MSSGGLVGFVRFAAVLVDPALGDRPSGFVRAWIAKRRWRKILRITSLEHLQELWRNLAPIEGRETGRVEDHDPGTIAHFHPGEPTRDALPGNLGLGYSDLAPVGAVLETGDPLGRVHARSQDDADAAAATLVSCYEIAQNAPATRPVILDRIAS